MDGVGWAADSMESINRQVDKELKSHMGFIRWGYEQAGKPCSNMTPSTLPALYSVRSDSTR
jgi:hypothetical protein